MRLQDNTIIATDILIILAKQKIIFPQEEAFKKHMNIIEQLEKSEIIIARDNGGLGFGVNPKSVSLYDVAEAMQDPEGNPKAFELPSGINKKFANSYAAAHELYIKWLKSTLIIDLAK